jgi:hypothetical protein
VKRFQSERRLDRSDEVAMSVWIYQFGTETFGKIDAENIGATKAKSWFARLYWKQDETAPFESLRGDDGKPMTRLGSSESTVVETSRACLAAKFGVCGGFLLNERTLKPK